MEGQWVCFVQGTRVPADQCPPDSKKYWYVDYAAYDSPESYAELQEQKRITGTKAQALFDANPKAYPPCSADPPHPASSQCGNEDCDLHNILWLQIEGATLEQAIGLAAVYNYDDSYVGVVSDALGGMDEFHQINDEGPNMPALFDWYNAHKPLVHYLMETRELHSLDSYWWCAIHNDYEAYPPKHYETLSVLLHKIDGQWKLFDVPGFGPLHPGFERADEFLAAAGCTGSQDWWQTHQFGHFEYLTNPE